MPEINDSTYYETRASEARKLAETAISPAISGIHLEMAENHDRLAAHAKRPKLEIFKK